MSYLEKVGENKMKIKEISVEVKKSKNFQTFSCSEVVTLEEGDNAMLVKKQSFERCNIECMEQIAKEDERKQVISGKVTPQIIPPRKTIIKG